MNSPLGAIFIVLHVREVWIVINSLSYYKGQHMDILKNKLAQVIGMLLSQVMQYSENLV